MFRTGKSTEKKSGLLVVWVQVGEMGVTASGHKACFQCDENVLELGNSDNAHCEHTKNHLKMVNVLVYELYPNSQKFNSSSTEKSQADLVFLILDFSTIRS